SSVASPFDSSAAPIRCTAAPFSTLEVDLLVLPWCEEGRAVDEIANLASGGEINRALHRKEFSGRLYETFSTNVVDAAWHARRLLLIGAGKQDALDADVLRRVATAAALWTKQRRIPTAGFVVPAMSGDAGGIVQAIAEGLTLAEFNIGSYKTGGDE